MATVGDRTYSQDRFEARYPELEALLGEAGRHAHLASLPARDLAPGDSLVVPAGDFFLAAEGQFLLQPEAGDERTARAPCVVGLLEASLRLPTDVRLTAMQATRGHLLTAAGLAELRLRDPWFQAYERALLVHQLGEVHRELRASRQHVQDFYLKDTAALLPGPYFLNDADMVAMVLESEDPGWVGRQLPPGVCTPPRVGSRYLLVLAHFGDVQCEHAAAEGVRFDYQETTVFLPCLAWGRPGVFTPILFPDSLMAVTLGREVYGFPKRFGKTVLDLGQRYAELEVDERVAFWCEWGEPQPVEASAFADRFVEVLLGDDALADKLGDLSGWWFKRLFGLDARQTFPPASAFVRQVVPDVAIGGERRVVPAEDRLVRIPFDIGDAKAFHLLPGPRFQRVKADFLPPSRVLLAGSLNLDMRFGVQQVLADYVGPLDHARLASRAMRRSVRRCADLGRGLWSFVR